MSATAEVIEYTPGIPEEVLGSANTRQGRHKDHGPYALYSPGKAIHRVDARDGTPHIFAGYVENVGSYGNWDIADHITEADVADIRTIYPPATDPSARPRQEKCITIWASDKVGLMTKVSHANCHVQVLDSLSKRAPQVTRIDLLNQFINPKVLAWEVVGHPSMSGRLSNVPPDKIDQWRQDRIALERDIKDTGVLKIRQRWIQQAIDEGLATKHPMGKGDLWMTACEQMIQALEQFWHFAISQLKASDAEIEEAKAGNNDKKKAYDVFDREYQWLTGYKAPHELALEAAQRPLQVQAVLPPPTVDGQAADISRKECPKCFELIATKANYCRFCKTDLEAHAQKQLDLEAMRQKRLDKQKQKAAVDAAPSSEESGEMERVVDEA